MSFHCKYEGPFRCFGQCKKCAEQELDQALLQQRCEQQSESALVQYLMRERDNARDQSMNWLKEYHLACDDIGRLRDAVGAAENVYRRLEAIKLTSEDVFSLAGLGQALADLHKQLVACGMQERK